MSSEDIIASIQNWEAIRGDSQTLNNYFRQGNRYAYDFPAYAATSESLHAYPGIYNDDLYFFMIPSEYDKEEYHDTLDQYTEPCLLVNTVSGGDDRLTSAEAKARMRAWEVNYPVWVPEQVNGPYGIFQAFAIPTKDFEVESVVISLGLKAEASATAGLEADLIVVNADGKDVVYDDFTQVVPPYNAYPSSEDFYLLSASL